jgi:hypothetical protein
VEHEGRPFAYAQDYSPHDWADHPFAHLPPGSRGIDQYIGGPDMIGRGHGSAFARAHCDRLLAAGAPAIAPIPTLTTGVPSARTRKPASRSFPDRSTPAGAERC